MPSWWYLIGLAQDCYVREFKRLCGAGFSALWHSVDHSWRWKYQSKAMWPASMILWLTFATSGHRHRSMTAFPLLEMSGADPTPRATLVRDTLRLKQIVTF